MQTNRTKELENKGADTSRIARLEEQLSAIKTELAYIDEKTETVFNYRKDEKELFSKVNDFKTQKELLENKLKEVESKHELQQQKLKEELAGIVSGIVELKKGLAQIEEDSKGFEQFCQTDVFLQNTPAFQNATTHQQIDRPGVVIMKELTEKHYSRIGLFDNLKSTITTFNGNFGEDNIFKFKTRLIENTEYYQFAEDLKEFIEEDKISEYEKRVNERFAGIIRQIGSETGQLLSKESVIRKVINDINADFVRKIFVGVIKSIELRLVGSSNKIVQLLGEIKAFNDENISSFGEIDLFNANQQNREENNKKAVMYLSALSKAIAEYKGDSISLGDSFELEFRVVENDNDTGWVDKLANVGSDGTDVLVKAMINIMLLNVFKEGATKNQFKEFRLHCMMDEIGKLHPNNVRGILKFANDRNIFLVNGSPMTFDAAAYKYTYQLSKRTDTQTGKAITVVNRIINDKRK